MDNEKISQLMYELKKLTYNWTSSGSSYTSQVINKEGVDRVEQVIRGFLLDNRDDEFVKLKTEIAILESKVFMYEQLISKSNFAPMIYPGKPSEETEEQNG